MTQAVTDANLANTRIGSGSDHTVFLNFVGLPVIGLGFDGDYGVYHSMYDDFYWMNHFGDPGYRYHTLMSQLWGVLALRLANADLLPFDFGIYGNNIRQFVAEMSKGKDMSQLDLKPIAGEIDRFEAAGNNLNQSVATALASGKLDPRLADTINHGMMQVERNWLNPDGIPGTAMVQAHPVRRAFYLCTSRTARPDRSCRSRKLGYCPSAGCHSPARAVEQYQFARTTQFQPGCWKDVSQFFAE